MHKQPCFIFLTFLFALTIVLSAGCTQAGPTSAPVSVAPATDAPAMQAPDPTAPAPESPAVQSPATKAPASATPTASAALAQADNWDDRSIFRSGLTQAAAAALDSLPGASVYHLEVQVGDDFTALHGQERVRYTNQEGEPLEEVYFQLFPNMAGGSSTVSNVTVDGQEVTPAYESGDTTVRVPLLTPLQPGQSTVIQLDFQVGVPGQVGGNYGLFGYLNNILVLDGFYPAIPVYDAAGWHAGPLPPNSDTTFQDASFYVVRVTAPAGLTLVASGVEVERSEQAGQQMVTFAAGPSRDFYLAASEAFTVTSQTVGETRVNSYAFEDRTAGAKLALDTAAEAIESFSARFGEYPYTEFDVVSTPMQGALGIEYPGLTGINLNLFDPGETVGGLPASMMLESTVAHEVGHQWFYNVVGNDQANEPWVDEAITQYVTGLYFLDRYGQSGWDSYRSSWVGRWDRVNRDPIPIGQPAGSYQGREYGAVVYGRGPLFVEALAEKMGQAKFDEFMRAYYQEHLWGIGTAASFQSLAEEHCGCDLSALFEEWVY